MNPDNADARSSYAHLCPSNNQLSKAESLVINHPFPICPETTINMSQFRETLSMREKRYGVVHPSVLESMSQLSLVLKIQLKFEELEILIREVYRLKIKVLGP